MTATKNEIDEIINPPLPEARASVSYNVTSPKGYGLILTVRSGNEAEIFEIMTDVETYLEKNGYTPEVKRSFGSKPAPQVVEGENCPKCGSPLVKFTSKDGTKSGVKCSTSKWDHINKVATGCSFVKWGDGEASTEEVSPAQRKVLEARGLWVEGLTRAEATDLLTK